MRSTFLALAGISFLMMAGCNQKTVPTGEILADNIENAVVQYSSQVKLAKSQDEMLNPHTFNHLGEIVSVPCSDWTSGFFAGSLWHLHNLTEDTKWKTLATQYTGSLDSVQYLTDQHDVSFVIGSSFLNGMRAGNKEYNPIIVQAANSLLKRFQPQVGVIQSVDADKDLQSTRGWSCPVMIDNLMNLEILFETTHLTGDSTYYYTAISHADRTLQSQFRTDHSCYQVVDYDPKTGETRSKQTIQGYANESTWAKGQAWAIYGYTMCYRYTHKAEYLTQAQNIYNFIFTNKNLPTDLIPYWDYDALNIPNEPRDASAAAITASALYELETYLPETRYKETADRILETLSTPVYRAKEEANGHFILKHSVGNTLNKQEIDVPLNYADYYFLEALTRKRNLEQ